MYLQSKTNNDYTFSNNKYYSIVTIKNSDLNLGCLYQIIFVFSNQKQ